MRNAPQPHLIEQEKPKFTLHRLAVPMAVVMALVFWASAFTAVHIGLEGYTPVQLAFLRYVAASLALLIVAVIFRMRLPDRRDWPGIFVLGAIGFSLYNVTLNAGQQTVSSGVSSFIISSESAVIAVMAAIVYKERLTRMGWLGVLICLLGVALISFAGDKQVQVSIGALFLIVAMCLVSAYSVLQKPFLRKYSALQFTTYAIWAGTLCLFPFATDTFDAMSKAPLSATLAAIYAGVFSGAIAYVSWSYMLAHLSAARAGSYLTIIPVLAMLIAWLLLGEVPTLVAIVGGATVLLGVVLINRAR